MPKKHTVEQGEGISSIAFKYGFFPETVWNDPENAELRKQRANPNALLPGDLVTIPDLRPRTEKLPTGQRYKFLRKGVPAVFSLQLLVEDEPYANQPYELTIDGKTIRGVTDGEGHLFEYLSPDAEEAQIKLGKDGEVFPLRIGFLNPIKEISGVQQRLKNLAFDCGSGGELDDSTRKALRAFQRRAGLPETGEADAATTAKLEELHDQLGRLPEGG